MYQALKPESLIGSLRRLLFSPKGAIEGLLMTVSSKLIQVSMEPDAASANELAATLGSEIEVKASADHSAKTKDGAHPVYKLNAITRIAGKPFKSNGSPHTIRGIVAAVHYAKHGEPNGVILESGEFIHTRPDGMRQLKLRVGSKVIARGDLRTTVLGTPLIEAREVNRVRLK
jgi:hypothetical protein